MTREIKFRAYDKADIPIYNDGRSRMSYYGPNFDMNDDQNFLAFFTSEGEAGPLGDHGSMERYEIMQFTGLYDLRKKEVYESDIFTFRCPHCIKEHKAEIVWIEELGCWGLKDYENKQISPLQQPIFTDKGELEDIDSITIERVLGNVFSNPDLLN